MGRDINRLLRARRLLNEQGIPDTPENLLELMASPEFRKAPPKTKEERDRDRPYWHIGSRGPQLGRTAR